MGGAEGPIDGSGVATSTVGEGNARRPPPKTTGGARTMSGGAAGRIEGGGDGEIGGVMGGGVAGGGVAGGVASKATSSEEEARCRSRIAPDVMGCRERQMRMQNFERARDYFCHGKF